MTEVLEEEVNGLKNSHHQNVCEKAEYNDPTFSDKVKTRAYEIWCRTRREDPNTNYYQALDEIRKEA